MQIGDSVRNSVSKLLHTTISDSVNSKTWSIVKLSSSDFIWDFIWMSLRRQVNNSTWVSTLDVTINGLNYENR